MAAKTINKIADIIFYAVLCGIGVVLWFIVSPKCGWLFGGFLTLLLYVNICISNYLNIKLGNQANSVGATRFWLLLCASFCFAIGISI